MLLAAANCLSAGYENNTLFSDVSFKIETNDRVGFIGANGVGKTTLFRILMKELEPFSGELIIPGNTRIECVEQHACAGSSRSVIDELMTVYAHMIERERMIDEMTLHLENLQGPERDKLIAAHTDANERFIADGGLTYKAMARSSLLGLGFSESEFDKPVYKLSGGEKTKLSLAKLLNGSADLILLDEPTNHLDVMSVVWLEDFLSHICASFIVISHDRFFLDRVTNKTMELRSGRLYCADESYSGYVKIRSELLLTESRVRAYTLKEINRIEGIIEQQRSFNRERNYKTIASKQKQIDRLRETLPEKEKSSGEMKLSFNCSARGGDEVLKAEGLSKSFGDRMLFSDLYLNVRRGDRIVFMGENGCGKSTLLKILAHRLQPDAGYCAFGSSVSPGYFDQNGEGLFGPESLLDWIQTKYPKYTTGELRSKLALFLFRNDEIEKSMSELSGGERARAALLDLMLSGSNLLLLDEPTNHLDVDSREVLESALEKYEGTVIAVSHDRFFIERIAKTVFLFSDGSILRFEGDFDECARLMKNGAVKHKQIKKNSASEEYKAKKERLGAQRRAKNRILTIENKLKELDSRRAEINSSMSASVNASDYELLSRLADELNEIDRVEEELTDEYLTLDSDLL